MPETETLTRAEIAAMWLLGEEYSRQRLGAVDFYAALAPHRKRMIADFLAQLDRARSSEGATHG